MSSLEIKLIFTWKSRLIGDDTSIVIFFISLQIFIYLIDMRLYTATSRREAAHSGRFLGLQIKLYNYPKRNGRRKANCIDVHWFFCSFFDRQILSSVELWMYAPIVYCGMDVGLHRILPAHLSWPKTSPAIAPTESTVDAWQENKVEETATNAPREQGGLSRYIGTGCATIIVNSMRRSKWDDCTPWLIKSIIIINFQ